MKFCSEDVCEDLKADPRGEAPGGRSDRGPPPRPPLPPLSVLRRCFFVFSCPFLGSWEGKEPTAVPTVAKHPPRRYRQPMTANGRYLGRFWSEATRMRKGAHRSELEGEMLPQAGQRKAAVAPGRSLPDRDCALFRGGGARATCGRAPVLFDQAVRQRARHGQGCLKPKSNQKCSVMLL